MVWCWWTCTPAHERVLYERMKKLLQGPGGQQSLLVPQDSAGDHGARPRRGGARDGIRGFGIRGHGALAPDQFGAAGRWPTLARGPVIRPAWSGDVLSDLVETGHSRRVEGVRFNQRLGTMACHAAVARSAI